MPLALRNVEAAAPPRTIPEWLVSRDAPLQRKADDALSGMGQTSATRYLIEIAWREEAKRRNRFGLYQAMALITLMGVVILLACGGWLSQITVVLTALMIPLSVVERRVTSPSPLQEVVLQRLAARAADVTALPIFVDALWRTEESVQKMFRQRLVEGLGLLASSQELTDKQWAVLAACLTQRSNTVPRDTWGEQQQLAIAILGAMERTGYTGSIDAVNRLRTDPPRHMNVPQVFRAANSCWDKLHVSPTPGLPYHYP